MHILLSWLEIVSKGEDMGEDNAETFVVHSIPRYPFSLNYSLSPKLVTLISILNLLNFHTPISHYFAFSISFSTILLSNGINKPFFTLNPFSLSNQWLPCPESFSETIELDRSMRFLSQIILISLGETLLITI